MFATDKAFRVVPARGKEVASPATILGSLPLPHTASQDLDQG